MSVFGSNPGNIKTPEPINRLRDEITQDPARLAQAIESVGKQVGGMVFATYLKPDIGTSLQGISPVTDDHHKTAGQIAPTPMQKGEEMLKNTQQNPGGGRGL